MINRIKLEHLVELMESENYRDRFVAEYIQLKQRHEKLKRFNTKIEAAIRTIDLDNGVDEPIHDCPAELLREQQAAMGEHLHLLEVRAVIEDIDLEEAISYLIYKALRAEREYHGFTACECPPHQSSCCCQKDSVPPCEEEIYNAPEGHPEEIIPFDKLMRMLEAAVECEEHAGDQPCKAEKCPVWNGEKCLWGEAELYTNALYYLKKYATCE